MRYGWPAGTLTTHTFDPVAKTKGNNNSCDLIGIGRRYLKKKTKQWLVTTIIEIMAYQNDNAINSTFFKNLNTYYAKKLKTTNV